MIVDADISNASLLTLNVKFTPLAKITNSKAKLFDHIYQNMLLSRVLMKEFQTFGKLAVVWE